MIYAIRDNYGTRKTSWTLRGVLAWLPYTGTAAVVYNRLTGRWICARTYTNAPRLGA